MDSINILKYFAVIDNAAPVPICRPIAMMEPLRT